LNALNSNPSKAEKDHSPQRAPVNLWGHRLALWLTVTLCCALSFARAATEIDWLLLSPLFGFNHSLSDGSAFSDEMTVQIGIFENSFIPTDDNLTDWPTHWRALSEANFLPPTGIAESFSTQDQPANFPPFQQFYAFGYQQVGPNEAEVFLATDPAWLIPSNDPFTEVVQADIPLASTFIVGSVDGTLSVQTEAVGASTPPPLYYTEWLLKYFSEAERGDPLVTGVSADPDGDGLGNALEYLAGSEPGETSLNPLRITAAPGGDLKLSFNLSGSARADWKLRRSMDLTAPWIDAVVQPTTNASFDALELLVTPGSSAEFWRMQVLTVEP
jgi:hypothetical protein